MMEVARDMERLSPEAWLIQSGNPVFDGCTLMTRETGIKVCGLCHGHYGYHRIAKVLGMDLERVDFQAPGVNHCIWMTHFLHEGQDAYPRIDRWIDEHGEDYWATHEADGTHDIQLSRGAVHQYRMYGLFPIGDSPRLGGWWYHTDIATKKHWFGEPYGGPDTHIARPVHVDRLEKRLAQIRAACEDPSARMTEVFGTGRTREQQVPIIDALTNDVRGTFQVNVPNRGALPGVEDDVVVEVPAVIDRKGIQPLRVEPLPKKIMLEQLLPMILGMERGLEAYRTGDRSMLLWNALQNHQTRSFDQAFAALEELLRQPENQELAEHFRYPWTNGESARYLQSAEGAAAG
jgi:alpha-galactosidase